MGRHLFMRSKQSVLCPGASGAFLIHPSCMGSYMCIIAYVERFLKRFPGFCWQYWRAGVLSSILFAVVSSASVFIGVNKSSDLQLFKSRGKVLGCVL